jgi:preprotein translocase subunit SecG
MMIVNLLYIVFVLAAIVLIVVILLQEGKGGGFGEALGGHGQATFGVGAGGINKFTAWIAGVFLVSAMLITILGRKAEGSLVDLSGEPGIDAPPGDAPAGGGGEDE